MDVPGVNQVKSKRQAAKRSKKGIKVVYIASPMKVKTSASKFRDLVQELTGQDSDTARYMEVNGGDHHQGSFNFSDQQFGVDINGGVSSKLPLSNFCGDFLPYSESVFKSFNEHLQFDVLGGSGPV